MVVSHLSTIHRTWIEVEQTGESVVSLSAPPSPCMQRHLTPFGSKEHCSKSSCNSRRNHSFLLDLGFGYQKSQESQNQNQPEAWFGFGGSFSSASRTEPSCSSETSS